MAIALGSVALWSRRGAGVAPAVSAVYLLSFIGLLNLTPFLLTCVAPFVAPERRPLDREALRAELLQGRPAVLAAAETAAQAAAIVLALWVSIGTEAGYRFQALYLCFLPLIWIVLRRGILREAVHPRPAGAPSPRSARRRRPMAGISGRGRRARPQDLFSDWQRDRRCRAI